MVKLTWDLAATAAVLARRGHEDIDGLPICKLCNEGHSETSWHFMAECTCPDLVSIRRQTFQEIKSFLVASKLSEQEVALFGKIWAPAEEGFFVPDMIKSDDTFVNDHSAQRGWESKLSKSLCNALAMRRWGAVGLVHHAWRDALVASGLRRREARSLTVKIVKTMTHTIQQLWKVRNKVYHTVAEARSSTSQSREELAQLLSSEQFLNWPSATENILQYSQGLKGKRLRDLLMKLKSKKEGDVISIKPSFKRKGAFIMKDMLGRQVSLCVATNQMTLPSQCSQVPSLVQDYVGLEKSPQPKKLKNCSSAQCKAEVSPATRSQGVKRKLINKQISQARKRVCESDSKQSSLLDFFELCPVVKPRAGIG
jgi:hypothetical protein